MGTKGERGERGKKEKREKGVKRDAGEKRRKWRGRVDHGAYSC